MSAIIEPSQFLKPIERGQCKKCEDVRNGWIWKRDMAFGICVHKGVSENWILGSPTIHFKKRWWWEFDRMCCRKIRRDQSVAYHCVSESVLLWTLHDADHIHMTSWILVIDGKWKIMHLYEMHYSSCEIK